MSNSREHNWEMVPLTSWNYRVEDECTLCGERKGKWWDSEDTE